MSASTRRSGPAAVPGSAVPGSAVPGSATSGSATSGSAEPVPLPSIARPALAAAAAATPFLKPTAESEPQTGSAVVPAVVDEESAH